VGTPLRFPGGDPPFLFVSSSFFSTTGVPLVAGRVFSSADVQGSEPVMIVSLAMARALWPEEAPALRAGRLGGSHCVRIDSPTDPCRTVVGVVNDVHRSRLVEKSVMFQYYMPLTQAQPPWGVGELLARTRGNAAAVAGPLLRQIRPLLPPGVYATVAPMRAQFARQVRQWELGATLFSAFGLLALLVAAVGTYSTIAYSVSGRTRELGVRIALGARSTSIVRLVTGGGVALVSVGVGVGLALSMALGRLIATLLYNTSPYDPLVLAGVSVTLLAVAILASLVPAWRAARVDPIAALRAE
jgi:hypothetical protein